VAYTTIDDPSAHFQIATWTGNDSNDSTTQTITNDGNSDLRPDWVWVKQRSHAAKHHLVDSTRGAGIRLVSDNSDAEEDQGTNHGVIGFHSDGFNVGHRFYGTNDNGYTYVGWQWKANGGTTSSFTESGNNPGGTIQTNTTAGFSIITTTGTGNTGTIAHGLGAVPEIIISKQRSNGENWAVYHGSNTSAPETEILTLNTTDATADNANGYNDTAPTSSVFTVHTKNEVNTDARTYVHYVFTPIQGYSKFGSYTGNGDATNGPFVYTGFKPAWIMQKRTDSADSWYMWDVKRALDSQGYFNRNDKYLQANSNGVQSTGAGFDFLSNGFRPVSTNAGYINASGGTYIYMAFAEHPFVSSEGVPTTAR
tara:strand:+ start:65 stop:1162 length:1098 start_codon:yes stop_codon:yes gene_type:complete